MYTGRFPESILCALQDGLFSKLYHAQKIEAVQLVKTSTEHQDVYLTIPHYVSNVPGKTTRVS